MAADSGSDTAYVLYVDHQNHPAPLSECFHATASRRLSSTVDRINRPSTVTQVDSAYCPQCFSFYDASSATQLGYCPKPTCLQCPLCTSIISCRMEKEMNFFSYGCGLCDWDSLRCDLKVPRKDGGAGKPPTKEELADAVVQLHSKVQEKRQQGGYGKSAEESYQKMIAGWEGVVKTGLLGGKYNTARSLQYKGGLAKRQKEEETWSVEALENSMKTKKENLASKNSTAATSALLKRISLEEEQMLDSELENKPVESLALQALTNAPSMKMADLLPLQVPLRSRKSRRCRAELAEGKPGILLKPKLNPLEGDSSLRTGHGQWWKKDSSAVHVVPRVRVVRHGSTKAGGDDDNTQKHAFVLKVTNSTLGLVRLQLGLSEYKGEAYWDDYKEPPMKNPAMENLLVETLSKKHVDAYLLTPNKSTQPKFMSELVVLESAEDTIVEIGKVFSVPDEVTNWDAEKVLAEISAPPSETLEENKVVFVNVKKLAEKSGSAWFELTCVTKPKDEDLTKYPNLFSAVPISLQIEVGNGSWESSLIKKDDAMSDKPDMVSFDLVLTWPRK